MPNDDNHPYIDDELLKKAATEAPSEYAIAEGLIAANPADQARLNRSAVARRPVKGPAGNPVVRCDARARRGTGEGVCAAPLDMHGCCPNSRNHVGAG